MDREGETHLSNTAAVSWVQGLSSGGFGAIATTLSELEGLRKVRETVLDEGTG